MCYRREALARAELDSCLIGWISRTCARTRQAQTQNPRLSTPSLAFLGLAHCSLHTLIDATMADATKPEEPKEVKETPRSTAEADITKYKERPYPSLRPREKEEKTC